MDGRVIGAVELEAAVRPEAKHVIDYLKSRGLTTCIITGDHDAPTRRLAEQLDIDCFFAEVLPQEKAMLIRRLQETGKSVCFVGDGINDSIALKTANVSISIHGASAAAVDTAGVVLMDGTLRQLPDLFGLASAMEGNIRDTFAISLVFAALGTAGALFLNFGLFDSFVLYVAGLAAGTLNATRPRLERTRRGTTGMTEQAGDA